MATDFALTAETAAAFVLPSWESISVEDAAASTHQILWQVNFSILIDNVSAGEAGFGTLAFDISLHDTIDYLSSGWQANNPCTDATFTSCMFYRNGDEGPLWGDLQDINLEIGGTFLPPVLGGLRRFPLIGGPWQIGSLFLTDELAINPSVTVSNVEFTAMLADRSFSPISQHARGQDTLYLPRSLAALATIHVSTAVPEPLSAGLLASMALGFWVTSGQRLLRLRPQHRQEIRG